MLNVLFIFLFSFNAFSLTRKEAKQILDQTDKPVLALRSCGYSENWKEAMNSIDAGENVVKENCLNNFKTKREVQNNKYEQAKIFLNSIDCSTQNTEYLKAICIILQEK